MRHSTHLLFLTVATLAFSFKPSLQIASALIFAFSPLATILMLAPGNIGLTHAAPIYLTSGLVAARYENAKALEARKGVPPHVTFEYHLDDSHETYKEYYEANGRLRFECWPSAESTFSVSPTLVFAAGAAVAATMDFPLAAILSFGLGQFGMANAAPAALQEGPKDLEAREKEENLYHLNHPTISKESKHCWNVVTVDGKWETLCSNAASSLSVSSSLALKTFSILSVAMDFPLTAVLAFGLGQFGMANAAPIVAMEEKADMLEKRKFTFLRPGETRKDFCNGKDRPLIFNDSCNSPSSLPLSISVIFTVFLALAASMDFLIIVILSFGLGVLGNTVALPLMGIALESEIDTCGAGKTSSELTSRRPPPGASQHRCYKKKSSENVYSNNAREPEQDETELESRRPLPGFGRMCYYIKKAGGWACKYTMSLTN